MEFGQSKQSAPRVDPVAREGIRRLRAAYAGDELAKVVRDLLKAVPRAQAAATFNASVNGMTLPHTADRGRIGSLLRNILAAGRPDAFECLQTLATAHLETTLDKAQLDAYAEQVDALNEAVESGDAKKVESAVGPVAEALLAGLSVEEARRYVVLQALPEAYEPLLAAVKGGAAAGQATAAQEGTAKQTAAKKSAARKIAAKKSAAKKSAARKSTARKSTVKQAAAKKKATKKATSKKAGG